MTIQKLLCQIPGKTPYEIEIHRGLLSRSSLLKQYLAPLGSQFAIITDDTVSPLYGYPLQELLSQIGLNVLMFQFPSGEQHKTRASKEILENQMFERNLDRQTCVIALGGGVVMDLAGYVAATYCRGVPLVLIPTSLLAMVDACIGGKTGVNTPYGKNLLGCIYQPARVLIDPATLQTLPPKELKNGIVEAAKHGLIADSILFHYLQDHREQLLALEPCAIDRVVLDSCRIKKEIIEQDERESGIRRLLNFGHTIGHALEQLSDYSLSHGEAVAIGLVVESYLSVQLGHLSLEDFDETVNLMVAYGLPLQLPILSRDSLLKSLFLDKKSRDGKPRFVLLNAIGSCLMLDSTYCAHVEESLIMSSMEQMAYQSSKRP